MFVTTSRRLPPSWYSPSPSPGGIVATSIYLPLRYDTWQPCQCDPRWEFHYHGHDLCPVFSLSIRVEMELSYSVLVIFVLSENRSPPILIFLGSTECRENTFLQRKLNFSKYITIHVYIVKLTIFLTFWIFKMIEEKSLFHTMSRYRKIFKGDAARDSPRLFQHPPTLACVVRSSLEIRQKIITPILKADKFSIVYFVSRAKFFSIKNIDACNYIITYIWQNSIINTFKKKKDRQ